MPTFLKPSASTKNDFLFAHVAHRQHRAKEPVRSHVLAGSPSSSTGRRLSARILNHFEQEAGGMAEANVLRAESFLNAAVLDPMVIEVRLPEAVAPGETV